MTAQTSELESPQPSRRFRLFSFRTLGWLLAGLAGLITLLGIFYAEEDWRGKRAWETYRHELEAKGVVLDMDKFIPPPVPDDQNFTMTPFLAPLFNLNPLPYKPELGNWRDTNGYNRVQQFATNFNWTDTSAKPVSVIVLGHLTDFDELAGKLWKQNKLPGTPPTGAAAAQAILENMAQYQPVLEELRTASHRQYARFNVPYDNEDPAAILLPHLAQIKKFSRLLQLRALAELKLAKTDEAFEDLKLMDYLTASVSKEPFLITHLVRFATLAIGRQVIWEGLARNQWSDAQLLEIQARLRELDLLKDSQHSMEGERAAFGVKLFDYIRKNTSIINGAFDSGGLQGLGTAYSFAPSGWLYLEQVAYQRAFEERVLPDFDVAKGQVHPAQINKNFAVFRKKENELVISSPDSPATDFFHHDLMVKLLLPSLQKFFQKAAIAQTAVNETLIACALDRYRLANGKLPATLDALVPQFLDRVPLDVCNVQPLIYHPGNGNQSVLYSVGWNETDDGGTTVMGTGATPSPDPDQGDWVWVEYPAK